MKDTFYFSHDYNARQDFKIKKLHRKHGSLGYGIFWSLVEDLYNNANALPLDYDSMAYEYKTEVEVVKSVIHDFELFTYSKTEFGSLSVQKRLDERAKKSQKARDSAQKRWSQSIESQEDDANALPTESESNAIKKGKKEINKGNSLENEFSTLYKKVNNDTSSISKFINENNPDIPEPFKDLWNLFAVKYTYPQISKMTKARLTSLKNRLKEPEFKFVEILKKAAISKGLTGASWFGFDFIIKNDTNYIKVLEGKYLESFGNGEKSKSGTKPTVFGSRTIKLTPEQLQEQAK